MRFYENKPDKGLNYYRKSFAWFPVGVGTTTTTTTTVWLEHYWEHMFWNADRKEYRSTGVDSYNLLLEEYKGD